MKVFLSWSGERSRAVAVKLREWLPLILHYAEPWISDRDIAAGDRWVVEIGKELEDARFGIIVLTPENLDAPWILFEAGALSKAFSVAAVCPYLVGLDFSAIAGPLSQFQAKKADRSSTLELLTSMNERATTPIEPTRVAELFDALWPRLQATLESLPAIQSATKQKVRAQAEVIEDLVEVVRRIETRLEDITPTPSARRRVGKLDAIQLRIGGKFPQLKGLPQDVLVSVNDDPIADIARVLGFNVDDYGSGWILRDPFSGQMIRSRDNEDLLSRLRMGIKLKFDLLSLAPPPTA